MVLDQILVGLLTNAMSEVAFRTIDKISDDNKKKLKPLLEKAYAQSISATEKKYPKSSKLITRVIKNVKVKRRLISLKGGKLNILNDLKDFARSNTKRGEENLNTDNVLEYFYKNFIAQLKGSPDLQKYLQNAYLDEIARLSKDTNAKVQSLPFIFRNVLDIKEGISKLIAENSKLHRIGTCNFAYRLGAFQLRVYGSSMKDVENVIEVSYKLEKVRKSGDKTILEFTDESEDINVIRLMYQGSLYKVIYPPEKNYILWVKPKAQYLELTGFVGNKHKKEEIIAILRTHMNSPNIREVTFDEKITSFLKSNLRNVSQLKYNPRIKKKIKVKSGIHTIKGKVGIFVGDPGFLEDVKVKTVIDGLQSGAKNKHADIFYFKVDSLSGIYKTPMDFDFHRDGRIIGFFSRKKLNLDNAKKSIYDFIIKNGKEF